MEAKRRRAIVRFNQIKISELDKKIKKLSPVVQNLSRQIFENIKISESLSISMKDFQMCRKDQPALTGKESIEAENWLQKGYSLKHLSNLRRAKLTFEYEKYLSLLTPLKIKQKILNEQNELILVAERKEKVIRNLLIDGEFETGN